MSTQAYEQTEVIIVNLDNLTVTLEGGVVVPITNMIDNTGEETDDANEAVSLVAGPIPDRTEGAWLMIELSGASTLH